MSRYLVISFDKSGETFLDPVVARGKDEAKKIVEMGRPNISPMGALTALELYAIADDLSDSTDEEILQSNEESFTAEIIPPKAVARKKNSTPPSSRRMAKVN